MALMRTYKDAFQALKRNEPVIVNKFDRRELIMAHRIASAGLATYTTIENGLHGLLPIKPQNAPKTSQKQASDLIHVSHWRTGEREGRFSQQAYKVVSRKGEWVTYDMGLGKHHTVKAEYTKAVA